MEKDDGNRDYFRTDNIFYSNPANPRALIGRELRSMRV